MQANHDGDELQSLLDEQYAAPPLDEQFSANLVGRLQAAAAPSRAAVQTRRPILKTCLMAAAAIALVLIGIWIGSLLKPGTNRKLADVPGGGVNRSELRRQAGRPERRESASTARRAVGGESGSSNTQPVNGQEVEALSQERRQELEETRPFHIDTASPSQLPESLNDLSLNLADAARRNGQNVAAVTVLADKLYVVDTEQLYEVNPADGSYRRVGEQSWPRVAAMGAAGGQLYVVSDNRLYAVDPTTGWRRALGGAESPETTAIWAETKAIAAVGDTLYIAAGGALYRVNRIDGRREAVHSSGGGRNDPPKP